MKVSDVTAALRAFLAQHPTGGAVFASVGTSTKAVSGEALQGITQVQTDGDEVLLLLAESSGAGPSSVGHLTAQELLERLVALPEECSERSVEAKETAICFHSPIHRTGSASSGADLNLFLLINHPLYGTNDGTRRVLMDAWDPPLEFEPFLDWLKLRTERAWRKWPEPNLQSFKRRGVGGRAWRPGTRWLDGLTDPQIDAIQDKYRLRFPGDYRVFLRKLHAPDRLMFSAYFEGDSLVEGESPSLFNWLRDGRAIADALNWPLKGLVFDFAHNELWLDEWGPRPLDETDARRRIAELLRAAPPLVPVWGHQYLVEADCSWGYVVLSVWQSDIIVSAPNLRALLFGGDLSEVLGTPVGPLAPESEADEAYEAAERIPFWSRFLRADFWNSRGPRSHVSS